MVRTREAPRNGVDDFEHWSHVRSLILDMVAANTSMTLRTHRTAGWFTLFAFVAYLVVLPIHLATASHCIQPTVHPPVECCDHDHQHEPDSSPEEKSHQHEHHSADEHLLNAVKHEHSLVSIDLAWSGCVEVAPVRAVEFLSSLSVLIVDPASESPHPSGSRAPPCA